MERAATIPTELPIADEHSGVRLAPGQWVGGNYVVRGAIGEGGCGTIYEADHVGLHRKVAIKVPHGFLGEHAQLTRRFLREARISALVRHPNVLVVHDAGTLCDGTPYLVMEHLTGTSVAERLLKGPLAIDEAVEITVQVLSALHALAAHRIVHRDIKPSNVMLCRNSDGGTTVKLLDFGIAKIIDEDEGKLTLQGTIVGTPDYMAPEQIVGAPVDERADLYACGALLYELLTGRNPHKEQSFDALIDRAMSSAPRPRVRREDCSRALERVVRKALAPSPTARYATAAEMRADLLRAVHARDEHTAWLNLRSLSVPLFVGIALASVTAYVRPAVDAQAEAAPAVAEAVAMAMPALEPAHALPAMAPDITLAAVQAAPAHDELAVVPDPPDPRAATRAHARALRALALGAYVRAERELETALANDPSHRAALRTRVIAALARGDRNRAREAFEAYRAAHPRAADLADLRVQLGR